MSATDAPDAVTAENGTRDAAPDAEYVRDAAPDAEYVRDAASDAESVRDAALGEIAALSLKAARGAGHDWGVAEEAADAVRVLCALGLDGAGALCAALEAARSPACPLAAGVALSDRAATLCADGPLSLPSLAAPLLVLPFLLRAARRQARALSLSGPDFAATCYPGGAVSGLHGATGAEQALLLRTEDAAPLPTPPLRSRATVALADWNRLQDWAARTYAPATEASRQRGAGAADDPLD